MGSLYMNEAMFDLPDAGFVDRTVTYLAGTSPGGEGVLLMVERRPLPASKSLLQVAAALGKDASLIVEPNPGGASCQNTGASGRAIATPG